ncbi:MAG: DUF4188 domain-containing protein [Candidatus Nanopelagicales bacterium]
MDVQQGRWTAEIDGDFVVFLIGAMAHDPVGSPEATRLLMTMSDMLGELLSDPSKGLLAFSTYGTAANGAVLIQYWRSFDALEAYARDPGAKHAPVWREWNRLAADERSGAGIWHETYKVGAGSFEAVYQNMPVTGLQKAGRPVTVTEAKNSARARLAQ